MKLILVILILFNVNIFAKTISIPDYERSCHSGNGYACKKVAQQYFKYGDQVNARYYMKKACNLGTNGTCRMAKIYELINR